MMCPSWVSTISVTALRRLGEVDVKLGERMSVETADTVERTYPHHVAAVFKDFIDGIVRQPVLVGKIVYRECGFYWVKRQADEEESTKIKRKESYRVFFHESS